MTYSGHQNYIPGLLCGDSNFLATVGKPTKLATTAGEVVQATASTDEILGPMQNTPLDGAAALVPVNGSISKFMCGTDAGVSAGTYVTANSTGYLSTAAVAPTIAGYSLSAASAKNGIFTGLVLHHNPQ